MGSRIDRSSKPFKSHLPKEVAQVEKKAEAPKPEQEITRPEPNRIQAQLQQDGFDEGKGKPQDNPTPARGRGGAAMPTFPRASGGPRCRGQTDEVDQVVPLFLGRLGRRV